MDPREPFNSKLYDGETVKRRAVVTLRYGFLGREKNRLRAITYRKRSARAYRRRTTTIRRSLSTRYGNFVGEKKNTRRIDREIQISHTRSRVSSYDIFFTNARAHTPDYSKREPISYYYIIYTYARVISRARKSCLVSMDGVL